MTGSELRKICAWRVNRLIIGQWVQKPDRPPLKGFEMLGQNGKVYSVFVRHGGSWIASELGRRGALHAAKDFYSLEALDEARRWCETRARKR